MKIQINTDHNIDGTEALAATVEAELRAALEHFADRLTRLEVHLGDTDGEKDAGGDDKRCLLEARPEGIQPVVVTGFGTTVEQASREAGRKMQSKLRSTFGRLDQRDPNATIRQGDSG